MRVIPSAPNEMQLLDHRPPLPERTSPPGRKKREAPDPFAMSHDADPEPLFDFYRY